MNLFLQNLRRIGFTGFPLDDLSKFPEVIRSQITSQISKLKTLLMQVDSVDSYQQMSIERLEIIIPNCYHSSEINTFENYLFNSNLGIIDNLFFFEKWHQILSSISTYKSMNDFPNFNALSQRNPTLFINIRNEMRTIIKFVLSSYRTLKKTTKKKQVYSIKKLLNKLIQDEKERGNNFWSGF